MTNVLQFPQTRSGPPENDDLAALELELVRLRIAQVRSEVRLTNTIWFWYFFKRAIFWAVMIWLIVMFASAGRAQSTTRSFYDGSGSFAGSSVTRGNSSSFYGSNGSFAGSSVRQGKWTNFFDGQGRYTGSSIGTSPRR